MTAATRSSRSSSRRVRPRSLTSPSSGACVLSSSHPIPTVTRKILTRDSTLLELQYTITLGQRDGEDDDEGGDAPAWPIVQPDLLESVDNMVLSMRIKEATKRSAFNIPFVLGEGFVLGINGCVSTPTCR